MEELVLHPSVAVGWWLDYTAYADEAKAFLDRLRSFHAWAVIGSRIVGQVWEQIQAIEREYADLFPGTPRHEWPRQAIAERFAVLAEEGVVRQVSEEWGPQDGLIVFNLQQRAGISPDDASLVWLALREEMPLLVADLELYQRWGEIAARFPEARIVLISDLAL